MLVYDWLWWGQLTNQNCAWRGARRCAEGCTELRGGFSKRWWGKNQDFMLIRFLNAGI